MNNLLCIGFGYSAQALARILNPNQWQITGTSRSQNPNSIQWPGSDLSKTLANATHLLISVAPNASGDPFLLEYASELAGHQNLKWIGYLSTTAVYGDRDGGLVDEESCLSATTERGKHRIHAEQSWQALATAYDLPLHIFRLAGIYGSNRGPLQNLLSGKYQHIVKQGQVFSRIHVDDIANILATSIKHPNPHSVYNVCDDEATAPEVVLKYAATLLEVNLPEPISIENVSLSKMARSFYSESKRVSNLKIKKELNIQLFYPTYREGLSALFNQLN